MAGWGLREGKEVGDTARGEADRGVLRNARCRIPGGRGGHLSGPGRGRRSRTTAKDPALARVVGRVGVGGRPLMSDGVVVPMCSLVGIHAMLGVPAVMIARGAGPFLGMSCRMVQTCPHPEGIGGSEAQQEEPTQEGEYGMPKGPHVHGGWRIDAKYEICQRSHASGILPDRSLTPSLRSGARNFPMKRRASVGAIERTQGASPLRRFPAVPAAPIHRTPIRLLG